jgi:hypothetical protein
MKVTGDNRMPSYGILTPISYFADMIDHSANPIHKHALLLQKFSNSNWDSSQFDLGCYKNGFFC